MDYEKKYKEALESLKGLLESVSEDNYPITKDDIIEIFPDLKESDDEKIRKVLIELVKCNEKSGYKLLNNVPTSSMVAWLEKQGDKDELIKELGEYKAKYTQEVLEKHIDNMNNKDDERLRNTTIAFLKDFADKGYENAIECIDWLEKQGEQKLQGKSALEAINEEKNDNQFCVKSTNNVEPKFKVGDWIVNNNTKIVFSIKSYNSGYYTLEDTNGNTYSPCLPPTKEYYHLWSIEDAKVGDILASKDGNSILIFRHLSLDDDDTFLSYYSVTFSPYYNMQEYDEVNWLNNNFVPATKEQRDLLLQKMTEAGYEYDAEKEQLRKMEYYKSKSTEPNWVHHKVDLSGCSEEYRKAYYDGWNNCNQQHAQLKAEQKPIKWSEEDEKKRKLLIDILNVNHPNGVFKVNPANTLNMESMRTEELISWLKSLKPQNTWKPSDEQLKQLGKYCPDNTALTALYEQLKKLK